MLRKTYTNNKARTVLHCCVLLITHTYTRTHTHHVPPFTVLLMEGDYTTYFYSNSHLHSSFSCGPPGINGFYRGIEANVMRAMVRTHAQMRVLTQEYIAAHTHSCTQTRGFLLSGLSFDTCLFLSFLSSLHISLHSLLLLSPTGSKRHKDVMLRSNQGNRVRHPYHTSLPATPTPLLCSSLIFLISVNTPPYNTPLISFSSPLLSSPLLSSPLTSILPSPLTTREP